MQWKQIEECQLFVEAGVIDSRENSLTRRSDMKKLITCLLSTVFAVLPTLSAAAWAADHEKDEDRLKNSGILRPRRFSMFPTTSLRTCSTRPIVWSCSRPS